MPRTLSDAFKPRRRRTGGEHRALVLRVLIAAHDPCAATSRHAIDGVRAISFGRGPRDAVRRRDRDGAHLDLRLPDPMMSTDHGRLHAVEGRWVLDDPRSKNGAMVAGRSTRLAPIAIGDVFELGHTLFELAEEPIDDAAPLDQRSDELTAARPELVTFDPGLARATAGLARVAASEIPVLLLGESGTGKEVVARAVHALSGRRGAFVAVNCGALVPELVEAELFGHRRGAFTGAIADRGGYVRGAHRGTLFLDELGDLPLPAQAALLRVLQDRAVTAVGDAAAVAVDFRVCAATHRDVPAMVAAGTLRADLYARLLGVTVTLPPLRERRGDLGFLIGRLLARGPDADRVRLTPAAAYALVRHDWPLNIRELERTLAAAAVLAGAGPIDLAHLPETIAARADEAGPPVAAHDAQPAGEIGDAPLRAELVAALAHHGGNVAAVARELGKHREQVHRWVRRFAIDLDGFRR